MIKPEDRGQQPCLLDVKEHVQATGVHLELQALPNAVPETDTAGLLARLKLSTRISMGECPGLLRLHVCRDDHRSLSAGSICLRCALETGVPGCREHGAVRCERRHQALPVARSDLGRVL